MPGRIRDRRLAGLSASRLPLGEQLPLLPVVDGFRQLHLVKAGVLLGDCLQDYPPHVRDDIARLVPELTSPATAAGEWPRQRLFAAVLQCWKAIHQRQPLAIIVEDLDWSDGTTRDSLTYLSAQHSSRSLPVVLTSRPLNTSDEGAAEPWPGTRVSTGRWQRIVLTPLTPREVEEMAASVAPDSLSADHPLIGGQLDLGGGPDQYRQSGAASWLPDRRRSRVPPGDEGRGGRSAGSADRDREGVNHTVRMPT